MNLGESFAHYRFLEAPRSEPAYLRVKVLNRQARKEFGGRLGRPPIKRSLFDSTAISVVEEVGKSLVDCVAISLPGLEGEGAFDLLIFHSEAGEVIREL